MASGGGPEGNGVEALTGLATGAPATDPAGAVGFGATGGLRGTIGATIGDVPVRLSPTPAA